MYGNSKSSGKDGMKAPLKPSVANKMTAKVKQEDTLNMAKILKRSKGK